MVKMGSTLNDHHRNLSSKILVSRKLEVLLKPVQVLMLRILVRIISARKVPAVEVNKA